MKKKVIIDRKKLLFDMSYTVIDIYNAVKKFYSSQNEAIYDYNMLAEKILLTEDIKHERQELRELKSLLDKIKSQSFQE